MSTRLIQARSNFGERQLPEPSPTALPRLEQVIKLFKSSIWNAVFGKLTFFGIFIRCQVMMGAQVSRRAALWPRLCSTGESSPATTFAARYCASPYGEHWTHFLFCFCFRLSAHNARHHPSTVGPVGLLPHRQTYLCRRPR